MVLLCYNLHVNLKYAGLEKDLNSGAKKLGQTLNDKDSSQTNKTNKWSSSNNQKKKKRKKRDKKIYKVITGSAVVDFFGQIRDSAMIGNMRAFISDYVIVNKTAFMIVYNITLMFITCVHFQYSFQHILKI